MVPIKQRCGKRIILRSIIEFSFRPKYFQCDGPVIRLNLYLVASIDVKATFCKRTTKSRVYFRIDIRVGGERSTCIRHGTLIPFDRALISGIGSNMSLPSCIPQDQEFLTGQPPGLKSQTSLLNNRNQLEKNDVDQQKQRPTLLPLPPVNTACVPMNALEPAKSKCIVFSIRDRSRQRG